MLPHEVEEAQIIRQWLSQKRDDQLVEILVPRQGPQQELIQMAAENAAETLRALQAQWQADTHRQEQALGELQSALHLVRRRSTASSVMIFPIPRARPRWAAWWFLNRACPRRTFTVAFNIRSVSGPDDFASMEEVLTRRFNRWKAAQENPGRPGKKPDPSFALLPDLLIVDGGKGQLSRAVAVLERFDLMEKVPVAGLAKQNEELFVPGQSTSILLPRHSQGLFLIQRIRDEAHRFAITSHRKLRTKQGIASRLDIIPGIARRGAELCCSILDRWKIFAMLRLRN